MRLVRALGNLHPRGDTVVSIGTFDGVHRGHQHLLAQLVGRAQSCAAESVALTFHPHPRVVLDENMGDARGVLRDVGYLSTPEERSELMAPLGAYRAVAMGALVVILVLALPNGVMGLFLKRSADRTV